MNHINVFTKDFQTILSQGNTITPAANLATDQLGNGRTLEIQQKNVVRYNQQVDSTIIEIKNVEKIRLMCNKVENPRIPWPEILLGLSSLFAGAFLSAIISGIGLEPNWKTVVFYILSPVAATGCGVAFVFKRNQNQESAKSLADHILDYLPEIDGEQEKEPTNDES